MESRKRPLQEEIGSPHAKKRALTGVNGTPQVNGIVTDPDEPTDSDNLELFRKEAIFRRMKHYSREHERSQARIAELERWKSNCDAGLMAITACWTQLVDAVRLLAKPEDLPPADTRNRDLFDLTKHVSVDPPPDLKEALADKMRTTQTLITKIIQLGGQSQLLHEETYHTCQKAQTECAALRSEMALIRSKLRDNEAQKEKYHAQLIAAEVRADRLQSNTVLTMQARSAVEKPEEKAEQVEEPQPKSKSSASPVPSPSHGSPNHAQDSDDWQDLAEVREAKILELERENAVLRDQQNILQLGMKSPSLETIAETPHYKILLEHASQLDSVASENTKEIIRLNEEVDQLRASRREFEENVIAAAGQTAQDFKAQLQKRDNENLRLREQRDQQLTELGERKQKEQGKLASMQEYKTLAQLRSDRILVLQSELKRHKARLAANANNYDLLVFLLGEECDASYIDNLKMRLSQAEQRVAAVETSLSYFQEEHPDITQHIKGEADARQQLAAVTQQLEKFISVYGDTSSTVPDVQALSDLLQQKEAELQRLRLQDKQRDETEKPLYAELEQLSAGWEALDEQVKSKVFDLADLEEKLKRSGIDKAKSENKFYAAMRDKEASETERKNLTRNLEKQAKVIERLSESEKNLTMQVGDMEKEIITWKKAVRTYKEKLDSLEKEVSDWKLRAEGEKKRCGEYRTALQEREKTIDHKRAELRRAEEGLVRSKKEVERQAARLKVVNTGSSTSSQKEAELQDEVNKLMSVLKCSTCKMHMRNTVITKCMHSFCKECVDARISTRQRKCPACNLQFAQSDVQQVYYQ